MATMNISMPGEMKQWIESQVKLGIYSNSSDYIRDLVRQDQNQKGAFKKVAINLFGAKVTVVGRFQPVAILQDLSLRGAHPQNTLQEDTNYVLTGYDLSHDDMEIIQSAHSKCVPCVSLDHYRAQIPDGLVIEEGSG